MLKNIQVHHDKSSRRVAERLFGATIADVSIATAAGAFDEANVFLRTEGNILVAEVEHRFVEIQHRSFYFDRRSDLVLRNDVIKKSEEAPERFGIKMFLAQVQAAQQLNIARIDTFAAGYPHHPNQLNGYYTWARFGFNAPLDDADFEELPDKYATAQTINELMNLGGHEWWKRHGYEREMSFELKENSSMMLVLRAYERELQEAGHL